MSDEPMGGGGTKDPNRREPSIRGGSPRNPRMRDSGDAAGPEPSTRGDADVTAAGSEPGPGQPTAPGSTSAPSPEPAPGSGKPDTPVIYLDVGDEITSAAARVRRASGDRLAIVLPYGSHVATSRINFRLLAREAKEHGKHIEIVAADPSARALAGAAGLTVHPSVAAFEGRAEVESTTPVERLVEQGAVTGGAYGDLALPAAARGAGSPGAPPGSAADDTATRSLLLAPRDRPKVPMVGRPRPVISTRLAVAALSIVALLLLVGGAVAYSTLPSASISVAPRSERLGPLSLVVSAQPGIASPDPAGLTIPAQTFTIDVEASQTFPATGVKVSEARATGSVTFSSFDTGNTNTIKAGAVVQTAGGIGFRTAADAVMPPAEVTFPDAVIVPSTASVGIEALEMGPSGNVAATTITVLPTGENKNLTRVTNPEATSGGVHEETTLVSQADVDAALATLNDALRAAFDAKVAESSGVPAGTTVFAETRLLGTATPTVDPATLVDSEVTEFTLGLAGQGTVLGVDPAPVRGLAETRLRARLQSGWRLVADTIDIKVGLPVVAGTTISFPVTARATQVREIDEAAARAEIRGLGLAEARALLEDLGDVSITLWPDWVTTIPTNDSRVAFSIADPTPLETPAAVPSGSEEAPQAPSALPAGSSASPAP